jgi:hypothetical protein
VSTRLQPAKEAPRNLADAGSWPRLMRAETASRYVDETSLQAFRRRVGTEWPLPISGKGQRQKWDREDLDAAVARIKANRLSSMPQPSWEARPEASSWPRDIVEKRTRAGVAYLLAPDRPRHGKELSGSLGGTWHRLRRRGHSPTPAQ